MTKDEALDLALEALEKLTDTEQTYGALDLDKAITAIKQARSAPVQEPVAWMTITSLRQIIDAYTLASDPGSLRLRGTKSQPQQEPVAWPAGLIDRIKAAEQRIQDGHAPRRIPADPTDVDLVLAEVRYLLEGKQPPFWINTTPPAAVPMQSVENKENI
jgi:hypothetical protein